MRKLSRMETSKECRRVLNRHGVDLCYCQYSCSPHEVRLYGHLYKIDGSDFNAHEVDYMIQDFKKQLNGINVMGELENWRFTSDQISFIGSKSNSGGSGSENEAETYVLDLDELNIKVS